MAKHCRNSRFRNFLRHFGGQMSFLFFWRNILNGSCSDPMDPFWLQEKHIITLHVFLVWILFLINPPCFFVSIFFLVLSTYSVAKFQMIDDVFLVKSKLFRFTSPLFSSFIPVSIPPFSLKPMGPAPCFSFTSAEDLLTLVTSGGLEVSAWSISQCLICLSCWSFPGFIAFYCYTPFDSEIFLLSLQTTLSFTSLPMIVAANKIHAGLAMQSGAPVWNL